MELSDTGRLKCPLPDDLAPVVIGVDVGQTSDPSAIVMVEEFWDEAARLERYVGRYASRVPIGTKYDTTASIVKSIYYQHRARDLERFGGWARFLASEIADAEARHYPISISAEEATAFALWPRRVTVRIDVTGVGRGLYDMVAPALREDGARVDPVTLTASEKLVTHASGEVSVGKMYAVSRLMALVESGRITFPADHSEFAQLGDELKKFELRVREETGSVESGAFGEYHDDLVIAAALAVVERPFRPARIVDFNW